MKSNDNKRIVGAVFVLLVLVGLVWIGSGNDDKPEQSEPKATETLLDRAQSIIDGVVFRDVTHIEINPDIPALIANWEMPENFSGYDVGMAEDEIMRVVCGLLETGAFAGWRFQLITEVQLVDNLGNESVGRGLAVRINADDMGDVNCDNAVLVDVQSIALTYELHRLLQ